MLIKALLLFLVDVIALGLTMFHDFVTAHLSTFVILGLILERTQGPGV